jgi:hypothetical protein
LTARIIGMADLTKSVSDPCWKYLRQEVVVRSWSEDNNASVSREGYN